MSEYNFEEGMITAARPQRITINETVDGQPVDSYSIDDAGAPALSPADVAGGDNAKKKTKAKSSVTDVAAPRYDRFIWGIYILLLIISVIELYSASSSEVTARNIYEPLIRHGIFLGLGLLIVCWLQNWHYVYLSRLSGILAIGSFILLVYSSFFGIVINGAQRAIHVAGFTIQPPEIVKLTVVLWLATILARNQQHRGVSNMGVIKVATIVILFSGVLWKNGLTNTVVLMAVSLSMFLIGGIQWRKFFYVIGVYGIVAGVLFMAKYANHDSGEFDEVERTEQVAQVSNPKMSGSREGTHKSRFKDFVAGVHPDDPLTDENRQVIMAKFAQANGGMFGVGIGNSRESARLPLAFSDYIYSIVVEEGGLIGGAVLLFLYLLLLMRAGRIAFKCKRALPAFLIMGCAVLIVFQALIHMSIVVGIVPVSGQPLPFISKGGTSILVMSTAIGIMLSVSRHAVTSDNKKEMKAEANILPDDMQAQNYTTT
ncbi:MAG: FtsW/RodA/SpoVE family cell cycle protein [Bacteroidales bacterium]|nr:FtsW/RodA/SpoVE family cell cycle protein [Bacteroidales bacterium]